MISLKKLKMAKSFNEIDSQSINLIGKGTCIMGDMNSEGDIRIDGELTGNVKCTGRLVIGTTGKVTGDINCKNCEISGWLKGKLNIEQMLNLRSSANVTGDIYTEKLSIEPGSVFSGSCTMSPEMINDDEGSKLK